MRCSDGPTGWFAASIFCASLLGSPGLAEAQSELGEPSPPAIEPVSESDPVSLAPRPFHERYGDALAGASAGVGIAASAGLLLGFGLVSIIEIAMGGSWPVATLVAGLPAGAATGLMVGLWMGTAAGVGAPLEDGLAPFGLGLLVAGTSVGLGVGLGYGLAGDLIGGPVVGAIVGGVLGAASLWLLTPLFAVALNPDRNDEVAARVSLAPRPGGAALRVVW